MPRDSQNFKPAEVSAGPTTPVPTLNLMSRRKCTSRKNEKKKKGCLERKQLPLFLLPSLAL